MAHLFLPSSFQKRLLRYALSRVQLLDTDALDLANLDIAWGQRSTVELKDISLRLKQLSSLLHLPPSFELLKARSAVLRIIIPADIYNQSIVVEVEGVDLRATFSSEATSTAEKTSESARDNTQAAKDQNAGQPLRQSAASDPGVDFVKDQADSVEAENEDDNGLPTAADLASSFLETEPSMEKSRLAAALASQSGYLPPPWVEENEEVEDEPTGTGTALSLPGFLTRFLNGIADRLQVTVKGLEARLDVTLPSELIDTQALSPKSNLVTLHLNIETLSVGEVNTTLIGEKSAVDIPGGETVLTSSPATSQEHDEPDRVKPRPLRFHNTSLSLLSPVSMVENFSDPSDGETLLKIGARDMSFDQRVRPSESEMELSATKLTFGYARENILSFDTRLRMRASTKDLLAPSDKDVLITIRKSPLQSKVTVATLPVLLDLDLQRLDDTCADFGGFSNILGLEASIASSLATITPTDVPATSSPKHKRTVHFSSEGEALPLPTTTGNPYKIDARIGGSVVIVKGKDASVRLDTSAVKIVSRQEGIRAQVDRMKLSGPCSSEETDDPSMMLELGILRVDYLPFPQEVDLARLLSILSPSSNKYEADDDILVETLLRQRKQGPVLRASLATVGGHANNLKDVFQLSKLSGELARLSSVTKYLPEDDRAGILTLGLINDVDLKVNLKNSLGEITLRSQTVNIAHVSLPSLLAVSLQSIRVQGDDQGDLVGSTSSAELREGESQPPMIMARLIGDEMDPTLKMKLSGLRVEYRVPILEALSESTSKATPDSTGFPQSPVALSDQPPRQPTSSHRLTQEPTDEKYSTPSRIPRIDVALNNCVIGLNPINLPSQGALVLTETRLSGSNSNENLVQMTLDVKMSSLLIIDDAGRIRHGNDDSSDLRRGLMGNKDAIIDELRSQGYVPVGYISSAKIGLQQHEIASNGKKSIELQLNDNLLVLETCADSTQTLFSLFNGLKPPAPPSEETKYRTEIVPVQDMLASLSGDAFAPVGRDEKPLEFSIIVEDDAEDESEFGQGYVSETDDPDAEADITSHGLSDEDVLEEGAFSELYPDLNDLSDSDPLIDATQEDSKAINDSLQFTEDHFSGKTALHGAAHKWDSVRNTYGLVDEQEVLIGPLRIHITDVHVIWNLFDGYDWPRTRDVIEQAVRGVTDIAIERQARGDQYPASDDDDESVIGDFLFNSIYIGIPANQDPKDFSSRVNGDVNDLASESETASVSPRSPARYPPVNSKNKKGVRLGRSQRHKMAFELRGIAIDLIVFPPGVGETESLIDVRVRDFEIMDHVPTSTWRKFATYMQDAGMRESGTDMLHLEILNVRPVPELAASEVVLKANILPLRLHVDQDALDFLTRFFEFRDDATPVQPSPSDLIFLQRVEINSIRIKLDYKPKKIDYRGLRSGHTTEFMNFFILDEADMVLRHVIIYGVAGLDRLSTTLNDIWMPDIRRTQLPGVLAGLAPVRSLVSVGGGVRDLVVIPMQEYRKDGRLVRSIRKGALAFAKTTSSELIKLGAKLAIRTQTVLQGAEEMLNPATSSSSTGWEDATLDEGEKRAISLYADQPVGVLQGLRGAYGSLERDLLTARDAIVAMPGEVLESGSAQGAAKAVLQRAPTIIFRPAIGVTKALSQTLMGATNSLDSQHRRRMEEASHQAINIAGRYGNLTPLTMTQKYKRG